MLTRLSVHDAVHELYNQMTDPASLAMLLKAERRLDRGEDENVTAARIVRSLEQGKTDRSLVIPDGPAIDSLRAAGNRAGHLQAVRADLDDLF